MAVLNAWQKINRVLASNGGDGADGSATLSADFNTRATITGTATSTSATAGSTAFADGDLVLLHQTRGTGIGQWEINKVASGGGTTSLVFTEANHYTFVPGAQILKIPRYTTATINSTAPTVWGGSVGGVSVIAASVSCTIPNGQSLNINGGGDRGSAGVGVDTDGTQGEGLADRGVTSTANNGPGGGGGSDLPGGSAAGGGGGGNAAAGTDGGNGSTGQKGIGGTLGGAADGTTIVMGGGGGSGGGWNGTFVGGAGGGGGQLFFVFTPDFTVSGGITSTGAVGSPGGGGGGGGAGGSVMVHCNNYTIGSSIITCTGGAGGDRVGDGGAGGAGAVGRVSIHYSGTQSGTSNPAQTATLDTWSEDTGNAILFGTNF